MGQPVGQISYLPRPWNNTLERKQCLLKRKRRGVKEPVRRKGKGSVIPWVVGVFRLGAFISGN